MKNIYLDSAASSLISPQVLKAADEFIGLYKNENLSASDITLALRTSLKDARAAVAKLIHCDSGEIALVQSTSHALGMLSDILPLHEGDNVLLCDLEYQASTISFKRQADVKKYEIRCVNTTGGKVTAANFEKYIDKNTKAIVLAAVQEINGYRADVKEIGELAKKYNLFYIVDGIQEIGALTVDVKKLDLDIYCAGGKKWLGNPFGMGFMYFSPKTIKLLEPVAYNYFTIQLSSEYKDYISYLESPKRHPFDNYTIIDDASKFELGGYTNYIGAFGLKMAVNVLLEKDPQKIEKHIKTLVSKYIDGLKKLGITVCSPTDERHMSPIVSFNFGLKNNDTSKEKALVKYLFDSNILVSLRCSTGTGGVRTSFHYYNTAEEIDAILKKIEDFLKTFN
jgi:cysteine desulfurase / selenocysteine lyase